MLNYKDTILSQYANSPTITQLAENMNGYIDQNDNMTEFYDKVWNIQTAVGFGLNTWGNIVGVSRQIQVKNQGLVTLDDDTYRLLILIKAMANITDTTPTTINKLLGILFKDIGRCYVIDLGHMAMRYVFEFHLTPLEYAILTISDVFPRPAGVLIYYFQGNSGEYFGFRVNDSNVYLGTTFMLGSSKLGYSSAANSFVVQPFNQGIFFTNS